MGGLFLNKLITMRLNSYILGVLLGEITTPVVGLEVKDTVYGSMGEITELTFPKGKLYARVMYPGNLSKQYSQEFFQRFEVLEYEKPEGKETPEDKKLFGGSDEEGIITGGTPLSE